MVHVTIKYLKKKPNSNGRVTRCFILLQEFVITILNKPGMDNVVIDFIYSLKSNENEPLVEGSFPNEHIFAVSINFPLFVDIANYLLVDKVMQHLSLK